MDFKQNKLKGVITNDRENLYFVGFSNFVDHFHWLNDEDLEKLINDRDSAEAPSCPYKIQPENQVSLIQKLHKTENQNDIQNVLKCLKVFIHLDTKL